MADVFISYSRSDRPTAEVLAQAIQERGWSVWWDRKIGAGESFDRIIERELESARCVVVIWSKTSVESEWVKNEAAAAVERGAFVPVMTDPVRLPIEFRRKQTIDLSGWDRTTTDSTLALLMDALSERLAGAPTVSSPVQRPAPAIRRPSRTKWLVAASVAAAVAIGGAVFWMYTGSTDYTLVCKGGGPFGISSTGPFSVRIAFLRGSGPGDDSLRPGQCAWTDRPLNRQEPTEMCYSGLSPSAFSKRFAAANELVRQNAHYDASNACMRVTAVL